MNIATLTPDEVIKHTGESLRRIEGEQDCGDKFGAIFVLREELGRYCDAMKHKNLSADEIAKWQQLCAEIFYQDL
jgi:hypothetical protein